MNELPKAEKAFLRGDDFALVSSPASAGMELFLRSDNGALVSTQKNEWTIQSFDDTPQFASAQGETSYESYAHTVELAKEHIASGTFEKVVLSRVIHGPHGSSPASVFKKLIDLYPSMNNYWFHSQEHGTWLGSSPELLLQRNEDRFITMSLAGTLPLDTPAGESWTVKERHEQQVVTDFILEQLDQVGATHIEIQGPFDAPAGPLKHLKTDISFRRAGGESEVLAALHPTPAVCGRPRDAALHFIRSHENHQRRLYTGYFGVAGPAGSRYVVNLRCLQWFEEHAELFVGGGITAGSHAEKEWKETELKSRTLLRALMNG